MFDFPKVSFIYYLFIYLLNIQLTQKKIGACTQVGYTKSVVS